MRYEYRPDYLIRWRCQNGRETKVTLEVKGFETEQDRQRGTAAKRWVRAVNHHGEFGRWAFALCKVIGSLRMALVNEVEHSAARRLGGNARAGDLALEHPAEQGFSDRGQLREGRRSFFFRTSSAASTLGSTL